jgi:L-aspartate oxidase
VRQPDFITAPAVVVGGGIAGLSAALGLGSCTVVANEPVGGGSSCLAQGGIAAAIGAGDSPAQHAADTVRVGAGLTDADIAALVTGAAPSRVEWLDALGVAFDRDAAGALTLGREAGHSRDRIVHAGGDRTGAAVMRALRAAVLARPGVRRLEGFELVEVIASGARAAGVLLEAADGARLAVLAPHVILATGGIGACFDRTTNPLTSQGAGLAAAARRGVRLADLEFVQFHPTALDVAGDPLPLLTEALRGAGAILLDGSGRRFMTSIHPDAELAPRDVVARAVALRRLAGEPVLLDATQVQGLEARFPGACGLAHAAGFDPEHQALPITPAAHFHMGGIATDAAGATSMPGLWACGEAAATGLHGGNRLASNSLLEGLVFGARIAAAIRATRLPAPAGTLDVPRQVAWRAPDPERILALRRLIGHSLGPVRSGAGLAAARSELARHTAATHREEVLETVARLLLDAAMARRESRGAHYRQDYPDPAIGSAVRRFVQPVAVPTAPLAGARSRVA